MEDDLLRREQQYRKENEQLEIQTKLLLEKVDNVKKIQDSLPVPFEFSNTREISTADLNLPSCIDDMGPKGMIHFYKAKLKANQHELDKIQMDLKSKVEEVKKLQLTDKQLSDDKEKWFFQCTAEKNQNFKLEKQIEQLNSKLQMKDGENSILRKENEQLRTEINKTVNDVKIIEDKLNRISLENDKNKNALKLAKSSEKEIQDNHKTIVDELTNHLKTAQRHKNELLKCCKKQIQLIDNLKHQNILLKSCKVSEFAETEFIKLLDWKENK